MTKQLQFSAQLAASSRHHKRGMESLSAVSVVMVVARPDYQGVLCADALVTSHQTATQKQARDTQEGQQMKHITIKPGVIMVVAIKNKAPPLVVAWEMEMMLDLGSSVSLLVLSQKFLKIPPLISAKQTQSFRRLIDNSGYCRISENERPRACP